MHEFFDDIAPHPEGVSPIDDLVHERSYVVRAYRKDNETLLLRGALRDQKPAGLYVPDDTEPLTVHHMIVDMYVRVPTFEIIDAKAVLETHPTPAARASKTTTATSSACRSPVDSPTRCANCSAAHAAARTRRRSSRRWHRWPSSRCGRCVHSSPERVAVSEGSTSAPLSRVSGR